MLIPVSEPIYARIPQYADRITPPMTQAAANPFRSSPFPSFAPTLILAEKKVNPSITKTCCGTLFSHFPALLPWNNRHLPQLPGVLFFAHFSPSFILYCCQLLSGVFSLTHSALSLLLSFVCCGDYITNHFCSAVFSADVSVSRFFLISTFLISPRISNPLTRDLGSFRKSSYSVT